MRRLNEILDTLPRTRFGRATREVPAFRTCGVIGYHLAVGTAMGAAFLAGVSLLVTAAVAVVCAASFFVYVYVRRWLSGREALELLDQVWFALLCTTGALLALGLPVLPHLDVVAVALCPFLAAGRVGCTLVGCCHGRPSSLGIIYREEHAREGFPADLVGIRLFPVPALEAAGLILVGAAGLAALPFAPAGHVFAWFLVAYGVLRFGLEQLRGDVRPHWLGLSKPQWMSLVGLAVGIWIVESVRGAMGWREVALAAALTIVLPLVLAIRRRFDDTREVLRAEHLREIAELVSARGSGDGPGGDRPPIPVADRSSAGVSVAVTTGVDEGGPAWHASFSRPGETPDCALLCRIAAAALPPARLEGVHWSEAGVLHIAARPTEGDAAAFQRIDARALHALAVRQLQTASPAPSDPPRNGDSPCPGAGTVDRSRLEYYGMAAGHDMKNHTRVERLP